MVAGHPAEEREKLLLALDSAMAEAFGELRRTVQKSLAVLAVAFTRLLGAARGGNGPLTLAALARVLPTVGTAHAREKRLWRSLRNRLLEILVV